MPPTALFDVQKLDFSKVLVDIEGIRKVNPQRHEMEQLTGIVYIDQKEHLIVGYKDVTDQEFWCGGHMPGYPLMPGVIICEAAAQLSGFYCRWGGLLGDGDFIAFGGMENVRFRGPVRPGDRLILVAKATKVNRRQVLSTAQGYVKNVMVYQADIIGLPFQRS